MATGKGAYTPGDPLAVVGDIRGQRVRNVREGRRAIDAVDGDLDLTDFPRRESDGRRDACVVLSRIAALPRIPVLLGAEQDRLRRAEATRAELVDVDEIARARRQSGHLEAAIRAQPALRQIAGDPRHCVERIAGAARDDIDAGELARSVLGDDPPLDRAGAGPVTRCRVKR